MTLFLMMFIYIPATDITSIADVYLENTYIWKKSDRTGNTYCMLSSFDSMNDVSAIIGGFHFIIYNGTKSLSWYNTSDNTLGQSSAIDTIGFSTNASSRYLRVKGTSL